MTRPGRKRLTMDLQSEIYDELKDLSKRHNMTLTRFLTRLIYLELYKDKQIHIIGDKECQNLS